jgi:hypothetical protein
MAGIGGRIAKLEAAAQLERAQASRVEPRPKDMLRYMSEVIFHVRESAAATGVPLSEALCSIGVPSEDAERLARLYYGPLGDPHSFEDRF